MEKLRKLGIVILILAALVPLYYLNLWLQRVLLPRRSFGRLLLYIGSALVVVFIYTFLLVFLISKLFPLPKR